MSNELTVLENLNAVEVFVAGGTDSILQAIREEVMNEVPDVSTAKGRKEIASRAAKVGKSKVFIIKQADNLKEKLKAQLKPITLETTKVENVLSALRKEVREPLTIWEDAEKQRIITLKERLTAFDFSVDLFIGWTTDQVQFHFDTVEITPLDDTWQEFKGDAEIAKPVFIEKLTSYLNELKAKEADRLKLIKFEKENAERKQKEREEKLVADAKAEAEAETAAAIEREAAAKKKAAEDAIVAEAKADWDKKEAIEAERKRIADEQQAIEKAAAKKSANRAHQKKINVAALADFVKIGIDDATAKKIIEAIARKKISNITINY